MDDLLLYSLKTGACLAVFYLFFKLLLSRDTFHRLNRIVVMAAVVLSFVLPFCVITIYKELPAVPEYEMPEMAEAAATAEPTPEPFPWYLLGGIVLIGGAVVMLSHMLISVCGVLSLVRTGRRERLGDGTVLVLLPQEVTPFSWWKYIVMSEADYAENGATIIMHERAHLRLHHSLDLMVTDIAGCLQWFNPAMWLLCRELRAIHEYEADEAVLSSGVDARQYQMLLIKKAAGGRWYSIANSFNHSKLKNRITMMLQTKSSRWASAKTLMVFPLTMLALGAFARTAYVVPDDKVKKENFVTHILDANSSPEGEDAPLYLVDGKEVANVGDIKAADIKNIDVLKGPSAVEKYGEKAQNGVVNITTKQEGETGEKINVTVDAESDGEPHTYAFKIDGRRDSTDKQMVWVVNGRELPELSGTPVRVQKEFVVVRDGKQISKDSVLIIEKSARASASAGMNAASAGLVAAAKGVAAARRALELAKDKISPEELAKAQAELAEAEKELAAERKQFRTEVRTIRGVNTDGQVVVSDAGGSDVVVVSTDKGGAQINAGEGRVIRIRSNDVQSSYKKGEEPLLVVDGKKMPFDELKDFDHRRIESMSVSKDKTAIEKYGKKAKNGVIEIITKK